MVANEADLSSLVGRAFPGGRIRIAHWENFLFTDVVGAAPGRDGLAHPAHLFHVPIAGAGTSLAELFELGGADDDASITIDYYDWEYLSPLREELEYVVSGSILEHERKRPGEGTLVDSLTFGFELAEAGGTLAARVRFRWHYWHWGVVDGGVDA